MIQFKIYCVNSMHKNLNLSLKDDMDFPKSLDTQELWLWKYHRCVSNLLSMELFSIYCILSHYSIALFHLFLEFSKKNEVRCHYPKSAQKLLRVVFLNYIKAKLKCIRRISSLKVTLKGANQKHGQTRKIKQGCIATWKILSQRAAN